jgi:hypothetical protein
MTVSKAGYEKETAQRSATKGGKIAVLENTSLLIVAPVY